MCVALVDAGGICATLVDPLTGGGTGRSAAGAEPRVRVCGGVQR